VLVPHELIIDKSRKVKQEWTLVALDAADVEKELASEVTKATLSGTRSCLNAAAQPFQLSSSLDISKSTASAAVPLESSTEYKAQGSKIALPEPCRSTRQLT
jgi:hypothetical protein